MTWAERCPEGKPCGRFSCPKCSPTKILPSHQRGSLKPGGRSTGGTAAPKGYVVGDSGLLQTLAEESFSTPDVAMARAKARAKLTGRYQAITRDGVGWLWMMPDGSTEAA